MERLEAQVNECLAASEYVPSPALDPSLVSSVTTHVVSDPPNVPAAASGSSTQLDSTPSTITRSPTLPVAVTPHRAPAPTGIATLTSPLTDTDEEQELPLTPVTNKKGKQTKDPKGKGKRPADEPDDIAGAGRAKRSKRKRT